MNFNIQNKGIVNSNVFNNIINELNALFDLAIYKKASDIHIRDHYNKCIVEFRINGILENYDNEYNASELISRIKIMAKMNVAEKRLPQDGNIRYKNFDLRVCVLASISGESIVIRILNTYLEDISLKNLGFLDHNITKIYDALNTNSHGLILITGPTGSGKSTTLLSLTKLLNNGKKKIISIEDPVENRVEGIVQIQVNEEIGLSFEKILRSSLRSDPDIIIVSEIRDEITAQIAIRASLTGHLVLASLHTNNSISTFFRLIDMNIPKYLILDCLRLIISQRLLNNLNDKNIHSRVLINEVLYVDKQIKEILANNISSVEIENKIKELSFLSLEDDAKLKGVNLYESNNI